MSGVSGVPGHQQKPAQHEPRMRFLLECGGAWRKASTSAVRTAKFGWKMRMVIVLAYLPSQQRERSIGLGAMLVVFIMTVTIPFEKKRQDTRHNHS